MKPNMTGVLWVSKVFVLLCFGQNSLALEGLNGHAYSGVYILKMVSVFTKTTLDMFNLFMLPAA